MTMVIAHRGSKGTYPENTLIAFKEAIRIGSDGIELDVQMTKDHQLIVIHDETVDRTTTGHGAISMLTLDEIKKLDASSWFDPCLKIERVPTLKEVLYLLETEKFTGLLNIEIKNGHVLYEGIEKLLVEQMNERKWSFDYIYSSFSYATLKKIGLLENGQKSALIIGTVDYDVASVLEDQMVEGIHPTLEWVLAHSDKLINCPKAVRPWTINREKQKEECFTYHLSSFHTDFPEQAISLRNQIQKKADK